MKRLLLGCATAVLVMAFAAPALAQTSTGYLEICKYADSTSALPVSGNFHFTVNGSISVTVAVGTCSAPFQVPAGTATIVEDSYPYAAVTSITTIPQDRLVGTPNLTTRTATVTVPAGDISTTTTVNYTNKAVTGYVEVCKQAAAGSGLTGNFTFKITGALGFSQTVSVPVGACSDSILVPAGQVVISEVGDAATYVTSIATQPSGNLVSSNLAGATATVAVVAGDVSTETITTFTNNTAQLKICKIAGDPSLLGQNFGFTVTGTTIAGSPSSTVTVPAGAGPGGTCELVPPGYRAGTQVTISENIAPGTDVSAITVAPSNRVVGSINPESRTVTVTLGSGETNVTYTDVPAPPGTLKICKNAGSGVTLGSMWTFTVGAQSVSVPAGSCVIVGTFPFDSTQTITEAASPGYAVSSITVAPSNRLVGSPNLGARTVSVLIGSGVTIATYTNATDPPATTTSDPPAASNPLGPLSGGSASPGPAATGSSAHSGTTSKAQNSHSKVLAHVATAHVIKRHGHHYLVIRVSSPNKKARVRLIELDKKGKTVKRVTLTVKSSKTQTVPIPYSSSVRSVKVALVS